MARMSAMALDQRSRTAVIRQVFVVAVIGNSQDVYTYCDERHSQDKHDLKREFVYIDAKNVVTNRPSSDACTVVGTRKLHNVRSTG